MLKRGIALVLLLVCVTIFGGCTITGNNGDAKKEAQEEAAQKSENEKVKELISGMTGLNERQKDAMILAHVTTDFEQMNDEQKEAAIKIDMLYEYLYGKYDTEFEYVGFHLYPLDCHLVVKDANDRKQREISANMHWDNDKGEYIYSDNYYRIITASDEYEKLVEEHLKQQKPNADFFLDVEVQSDINEDESVAIENVSGTITIVIENVFSSEEDAKDYLSNIWNWLDENDSKGVIMRIVALNSADFEKANYHNYVKDFVQADKAVYDIYAEDTKNGELRFW